MAVRTLLWAAVRIGAAVVSACIIQACANPELSYVELANEPGRSEDAGINSLDVEQDETTTHELVGEATASSGFIAPPSADDSGGPSSKPGDAATKETSGATDTGDGGSRSIGADPSTSVDVSPDAETNFDASAGTTSSNALEPDASNQSTPDADATDDPPPIVCECPDEINPCVRAFCLAGLTICTFTPLPGAECDDGNPCTQADVCDDSGACGGEPKDCSSEDAVCFEGVCNEKDGECEAQPSEADTPCDDDNRCSLDDVCDGKGECEGQARDCSDQDSSCTQGSCDLDSGECVALAANQGEGCDDDDNCTQDDSCSEGACAGVAIDCSAQSGACAVGMCDPKSGDCKPEPLSGIACDDGDGCTALDACDDGECRGQEADDCGDAGWLDLSSGSASVTMSNECARDDFDIGSQVPEDSDCDRASGDDVVFMLDLSAFEGPVTVRASTNYEETTFDTVLLLMAQECSDDALIACVDDSDDSFASSLELSVEPGVYALVVDAYRGSEEGEFRLDVVLE